MDPIPFLNQLQLSINAEHAADLQEMDLILWRCSPLTIQNAGLGLISLQVSATRTDLEPYTPGVHALPAHKLRPGDIVSVQPYDPLNNIHSTPQNQSHQKKNQQSDFEQGVVHRVTESKICVVCEIDPCEKIGNGRVQIIKLVNQVTHKRLSWVLQYLISRLDGSKLALESTLLCDSTLLVDVLLKGRPPQPKSQTKVKFMNTNLNPNQQIAVQLALNADPIALIHGPPGTGKTHTLIEITRQLVAKGKRVLLCGPSNISVDNLVERLVPYKLPLVRIGHVSRVLPTVISRSLDVCVRNSDGGHLVADMVKEMDKLLLSAKKSKNKTERRAIYSDLKELRKDLKVRERKVVGDVLSSALVVCTTLIGAGAKKLNGQKFDFVVIDECAQALEPECWLALLHAPRAVLAGDHLQLPPTIKSTTSTNPKNPLMTTLFERIMQSAVGTQVSVMLTMQYRMHSDIMRFSSNQLYDGKLEAHASVAQHTLAELPGVDLNSEDLHLVTILMDTAGCDMFEVTGCVVGQDGNNDQALGSTTPLGINNVSKCNPGEADLVFQHACKLINAGVPGCEIVVVTPYSAQVMCIQALFRTEANPHPFLKSSELNQQLGDIEVGSVDGMQGREKHAVIVSLVRSNDGGEVGFLAEPRRLNVAITRARRHLMVICDSDTVAHDPFCKDLVEYLSDVGELRYPGYE